MSATQDLNESENNIRGINTTHDIGTQTVDVGYLRAVDRTGPSSSHIPPSLFGEDYPAKPKINVIIDDYERIEVEFLGGGPDYKGRDRMPFRSATDAAVDSSFHAWWPEPQSYIILATPRNLDVMLKGLGYLLQQKNNAYIRFRREHQEYELDYYHRKYCTYENDQTAEAIRTAQPGSLRLSLHYADASRRRTAVRNGGRLIFKRHKSDGWTAFFDPAQGEAVDFITKEDICLWECEDALGLVFQ
ncbi:hypothetical protein F5Y11DRAFT_366459 [Daldinia sp. FL1419]|nr:hypothetical protein F5Y11DRAFT_366459 [Daldinia sp. FL1419]